MDWITKIKTYEREIFSSSTLEEDLVFLKEIGLFLQTASRKQLTKKLILKIESFYNKFNSKIINNKSGINTNIGGQLRIIRSIILSLGESIEKRDELGNDFYLRVMEFGEKLSNIPTSIQSLVLPILYIQQNFPWN